MNIANRQTIAFVLLGYALAIRPVALLAQPPGDCDEEVMLKLQVGSDHPWRPPFGLNRVGASPVAQMVLTADKVPLREYYVVAYRRGREVERQRLRLRRDTKRDTSLFFGNAPLASVPEEVALYARCAGNGKMEELLRQPTTWPGFQAEAQARPDRRINPVDLGAILVPHDWLLLANGQTALIDVAAISRTRDIPNARLQAWFEGGKPLETAVRLKRNIRLTHRLSLPLSSRNDSTMLYVSLSDGESEIWKKAIRTMVVAKPPSCPTFGAVETKLRYDAPISVQDRKTGESYSINYDQGWHPKFTDVVVFLPNEARFVFWRGSSYAPFWAGLYNTGFSYQWAETIPPPGFVDAVEPLQDKELRHSRVRIMESTPSRVQVRWTYQSVDVNYKSLGDEATEDYYFYPDGFGTRVVTLASSRPQDYVFSEFIVLTPQAAFPFDVLPHPTVDMLFLNGEKKRITFPLAPGSYETLTIPFPTRKQGTNYHPVERLLAQSLRYQEQQGESVSAAQVNAMTHALPKISYPSMPLVYRVADHKDDSATPVYFSPHASGSLLAFAPFEDRGQYVTPAYWGDHWPLGRGALTGGAISDRIYSSPSHFGLMDLTEPEPLSTGTWQSVDANGDARQMTLVRRAWLIAKTDVPDAELLKWGESFSSVPSLNLVGARTDLPSYAPERRAIRLIAEAPRIQIDLKPTKHLINPVFELDQAPGALSNVALDGKALPTGEYAWDGATLWVKASIDARGVKIDLNFR